MNTVDTSFKRFLVDKINWANRLVAITGARGVGKTTLLLQYIRENLLATPDEVIFLNMDDLYFSKISLVDLADEFVKRGGKYLFLDEVHKYKNWSQEIKNSYDYFPDLRMVVTGSSALDVYKGKADLSRRAMLYQLPGLSFREFIGLKYDIHFQVFNLPDLLAHAPAIGHGILKKIKPIKLFEEYLQIGYYPFFKEGEPEFQTRLKQTVNQVLESDLPSVENIDFEAVYYLKRLVSLLAEMVPYKPNIVRLSHQVGVSRDTLLRYMYLLEKADILSLLQSGTHGISKMNKPDKVFLNNPNLVCALTDIRSNQGTLRETFFINQLQTMHSITTLKQGDFLVDDKYTFEIGGKNKTSMQIRGITNAWIAADNIEYAQGNRIPLWLFGFLY